MLGVYLIYTLTNKPFNYRNILIECIYVLSICIAYSAHMVAKVNCGYRCAFCMAKSVVPPTFLRRSIGDHAQLFPTPVSDHVQLFRDHAQLLPGLLSQLTQALGKEFPPAVGSCAPRHARFYLPSQNCADLWPMQVDSRARRWIPHRGSEGKWA